MMFRKMMISLLVVAGLLMSRQPAWTAEAGTILVAGLNMRSGPGKDYGVIMKLDQGAQVNVLDRRNGWLKIAYEGRQGFILNKPRYIEIVPADDLAAATAQNDVKDIPEDAETIQRELKKTKSDVAVISRREKEVIEAFDAAEEALSQARQQVRTTRAAINATDAKIKRIEKESSDLKKTIRHNEAYAADRLAALYKLNRIGRIQLLATSDSFFDFIKRKTALERILEQDEAMLEKLHNDQEVLESLLSELNASKSEKRTMRAALDRRIDKLSAQQNKRRAMLRRIRSEKSLELAALGALKQAARELDQTMQSLPSGEETTKAATPDSNTKPFSAHKGLLNWPVKGNIISFFGPYRDKKYKVMNFQSGINIKAERGEPIRSISDGLTIFASWFKGFGNMMIVDHGNHYYTVYAHLEEVFKVKGDRVEKGEVIATVGDSGSMMGPALHFEVRHHGKPVDPLKWIRKG